MASSPGKYYLSGLLAKKLQVFALPIDLKSPKATEISLPGNFFSKVNKLSGKVSRCQAHRCLGTIRRFKRGILAT